MANNLVQFRVDSRIKSQANEICKSIGVDLPTYLRICLTRLVNEGGIPFSMKSKDVARAVALDTMKSMQRSAEESGISDLTPEEIDAEIQAARKQAKR